MVGEKVENVKIKNNLKPNKSKFLILPMINESVYYLQGIINTFLFDINKPEYKLYHIFILLAKQNTRFNEHTNFVEHYKVDEGWMYVFKVPEEFEIDYLKFISGEYSTFSKEYKKQIINKLPFPAENRNEFKIINKSKQLKEQIEKEIGQSIGNQEVCSIPNLEEETYE